MTRLLFCFVLLAFKFPPSYELKITVKNIQPNQGQLLLAVFENEKKFLIKPIASKTYKAGGKSMDFTFNLPQGAYAVSVFQDLNSNGLLDKGMVGNPTEPYGFSNNVRPLFSAPEFNACKFNISGATHIAIKLK